MSKSLRVLMVEDSEDDALLTIRALRKGGYEPVYSRVETAEVMSNALREKTWDVILCDYRLPQFSGLEAIALLKDSGIDLPLIIVSSTIGEETAADCLRYGARDWVRKSNLSRLVPAIERELQEAESRSKRRQAEERLRESEEALVEAQAIGKIGSWQYDVAKDKPAWSAEMFRIFGRDPALGEPSWMDHRQSIHPEDWERIDQALQDAVGKCVSYRNEFRIVHTDGSVIWAETIGNVHPDESGKVGRLSGTVQDITERKQAEESLVQEIKRLDLAQSVAHAGIWDWDIATGHIEWSNQMFSLFGLDPLKATASFETWRSVLHPEDLEIASQRIQEALEKRKRLNSDYRIILPDMQIRWINAGGESEYDIHGRPVRMIGICIDITDRKQAEDALRRSEENFRHSFDDSPLGVRIVTVDGETIYANRAILDMYGLDSLEELKATSTMQRYTPESYVEFQFRREKRQEGINIPSEYAIDIIRKDGNVRHLHVLRNDILWDGKKQYQVIYQDFTERQQAEEKLKASRLQLRALYRRLHKIREEERLLVAREIHDQMGGGLTGLKMDLSWLLSKAGDDSPEARVAWMDKIHTANTLIDQMIREVRRISTALRPSILDDLGLIAALEWQLSEFTSRTAIPHKFTATCEYINLEEDTAVAVFRIFQEALTNVMRHSRATKVVVDLREGERSLFGGNRFVLEIRDNGRGITQEEILHTESLGLLGMKERVLAFGGELSIYGEPGGGTSLVLEIPRKQGDTA